MHSRSSPNFVCTFHPVSLETLRWRKVARRVFGVKPEHINVTAALAANQGLYNTFLAFGIFWGLHVGNVEITSFFLGCVVVAAVFGAMTAVIK